MNQQEIAFAQRPGKTKRTLNRQTSRRVIARKRAEDIIEESKMGKSSRENGFDVQIWFLTLGLIAVPN